DVCSADLGLVVWPWVTVCWPVWRVGSVIGHGWPLSWGGVGWFRARFPKTATSTSMCASLRPSLAFEIFGKRALNQPFSFYDGRLPDLILASRPLHYFGDRSGTPSENACSHGWRKASVHGRTCSGFRKGYRIGLSPQRKRNR